MGSTHMVSTHMRSSGAADVGEGGAVLYILALQQRVVQVVLLRGAERRGCIVGSTPWGWCRWYYYGELRGGDALLVQPHGGGAGGTTYGEP